MAPRATARADELTAAELVAGGPGCGSWWRGCGPPGWPSSGSRPTARRSRRRGASVGPQEPLGATGVWVLPNPSGLNAHYQLPELTAAYAALRWPPGV